MSDRLTYWAAAPVEDIAAEIVERVEAYYKPLDQAGLLALWRSAHAHFYSRGPAGHMGSQIVEFGQDGSKLGVKSNQLRSITRYILSSTTSDKVAIKPRAINTSAQAMAQIPAAGKLIDYYHNVKDFQEVVVRVALRALLYGTGYLWTNWDLITAPTAPEEPDPNAPEQEQAKPPAPGDLVYRALSPLEVVKDLDRGDSDHDWYIIRRRRNKYDLAASVPALADKILDIQDDFLPVALVNQIDFWRPNMNSGVDSDHIYEYHLIHRKTPAMPQGRYCILAGEDVIVFDGPLPYRDLPIDVMTPEEYEGMGDNGYSSVWDLIGLQDIYDSLLSGAVTNFDAFAHSDILIPEGVEIGVEEIRDGLSVIRYPAGEFNKPEVLQKFSLREEMFKLKDWVRGDMEIIPGVNATARGEPGANLKSGAAMALIEAQAIHFQSGMVRSVAALVARASTRTLRIVQDFADPKMVAQIVGENDPDAISAYLTDRLSLIDRFEAEQVSPVFKSAAGRTEIANNMLNQGLVKTPAEYAEALETGRIDTITDPLRQSHLFAESVREALLKGPPVGPRPDGQLCVPTLRAVITDNPALLMVAAKSVLDSVENRQNPKIVQATTAYIMDLLLTWRSAPPDLLIALGIQPAGMPADPNAEKEKGDKPKTETKMSVHDEDPAKPDEGAGMPNMPKPSPDPLAGAR